MYQAARSLIGEDVSIMANFAQLIQVKKEENPLPFQPKLTYCNLFFAFLSAAFLGAVTETLFMLLVWHELQNRSGVVWGSFSLVWGLGAVLFSAALRPAAKKGPGRVFLGGALLGSGFELICSLLQERMFGMRFWDYRHLPLSLGGRIDPIFSVFWGLAALVWVQCLWPRLGRRLESLSPAVLRVTAGVLTVFMVCNVSLSAAALMRMDHRRQGLPAANPIELYLDEHYSDQVLTQRYPSMRYYGIGKT